MHKLLTITWAIAVGIACAYGLIVLYGVGHPEEALGQSPRVFTPSQGGTGIGTAGVGDVGNCLKISDDAPFTYSIGPCGTGGGGGSGTTLYVQNGGATLNTATTTLNFTSNSFDIVESPTDTMIIRVATSTLGLLASSISDFVSTVRSSITEGITGMTFTTGNLTVDSGYTIPTTTREVNQDTAYSWGNHASQGYITDGNTNWDNSYGFIQQGNAVSTTTNGVAGQAAYWTGISTLGTVATGTLSESILGIDIDNSTRGLFGGSAALSLTSGYTIPSTTRAVAWDNKGSGSVTSVDMTVPTGLSLSGNPITNSGTLALTLTGGYSIPSTTRLSNHDTAYGWGNHALQGYLTTVDMSSNTNFAVTALGLEESGDNLALTSGYVIPTTTRALAWDNKGNGSVTSVDMSVPTGLSISGNPITNSGTLALALTAGYAIPTTTRLVNHDLAYSWGNHASQGYITDGNTGWDNIYGLVTATNATSSITHGTTTNMDITTSLNLFGGGAKTTANAVCIQLTGSADLCDGVDGGGAGGSASDWMKNGTLTAITPTTTVGIVVNASSSIDALTVRIGTTTNATSSTLFSTLATFTNSFVTTLATFLNVVVTGLLDVGGGVLEIPNGSAPTIDSIGEIGFDSTDDQLIMADAGGTARVFGIDEFRVISFTIASSSNRFASGQSLPALSFKDGLELTQYRCYVQGGTSKVVNVTDGTNDTETITCGTTITSDTDVATNDTFTADELGYVEMGATTGTVDYLHFEAWARITRE